MPVFHQATMKRQDGTLRLKEIRSGNPSLLQRGLIPLGPDECHLRVLKDWMRKSGGGMKSQTSGGAPAQSPSSKGKQ